MSGDVDYPQGCQPINNCANVSQQIERLRHLAGCLYDCKPNNSEEVQQPTRFQRLFIHLSDDAFLNNSNTDFRIYLSLCLANILRVYQPEIPACAALDLKDVYMFLFRTLRGLGEVTTDSPKFKNYFHLVEAIEKILHPLSEMKDYDEKEATPVFRSLIKEILSVPCGKGWQKDLRKDRLKMLKEPTEESTSEAFGEEDDDDDEDAIDKIKKALITMGSTAMSELDYVPNEILDVFFYHIIQPQRSNFPAARALAQDIIRACMESENNPLRVAIRNIVTISGKEGRLPDEFELTGSNSRSKFFEVLRSLHHISYDLVSGAIEELNFWLQSENEAYRREAVQIVGMITCDRNCQFGMDSNDATWTAFLNAAVDLNSAVRLEFVKQAGNVLTSNHSHLRGQIINSLLRLSRDLQDEIRVEVVSAVTGVAKCKLEVISDKMLKACADRMKDKKPRVRINAIKHLMDLYTHVLTKRPEPYFTNQGSHSRGAETTASLYTESDKECVRFIPNAVFHVYRLTQKLPAYQDSRLTIERYIQLNFIPYQIEPKERCRLMVDLFRSLDDVSVVMFTEVTNRSSQLRRAMIGILSQIDQSGDIGVSEEFSRNLKERIRRIVQIFPEQQTLEKLFMKFVNEMSQSESTFNRMKQLMADNYTSEENVRAASAIKETMRRKINGRHYDIFRHFIDRIAPISIDIPTAKELIHQVAKTVTGKMQLKRSAEQTFDRDLALLKIFSEHFTHLFTGDAIVEEIRATMLNTEEPRAVEASLSALTRIFSTSVFKMRLGDEVTRREKWFLCMSKDLKDLIVRTEPAYRRSCKLAARMLVCALGKEKAVEHFDVIVETLLDRLYLESEGAANAFQVLGEFFSADKPHFLAALMEIVESDRVGPNLLTSKAHDDDDPVEFNDNVHIEKHAWPKYTMSKVYAAKFATKVLSAYSHITESDDKKRMERAAGKFIDLLAEIIEKKGDLGGRQCELEKARLRAVAASSLLKLAGIMAYRSHIDTRLFKIMSYQITDEAYCVRLHYAVHVRKGISRQLPIEFAACFGLVNLGFTEEEGENKLDGFKSLCHNQALMAFSERTETRAAMHNLPEAQRVVFCAETVIAYVVWLLANYSKLEKIEENVAKTDSDEQKETKLRSVNQLAEMQECLWLVIDTLKAAKCNMQTVWKVLEQLKTCGDKPMRSDRYLSAKDLREHNKKMWAFCDLGISMMLYRAKLQMEDQEQRDSGFNRQFFYMCTSKDKVDPSNVYAPDVLINDEKQRNGKLPKPRREFHVADLTAGFTPPPPDTTTSSAGSTTLKNVSRRGGNTSGTKKKAAAGAAKTNGKRKSAETTMMIDSDDDDDEDVAPVKKASPRVPRGRRKVYDLPESEEEEEEEAEMVPLPRKRGAPSSSAPTNGTKNGVTPPKKRSSAGRRGKKRAQESDEEEEEKEEEDEEKEDDLELDQLVLSPILDDSSGRTRRSARTAKLTASTPLVPPVTAKTAIKRKREVPEPVEESEEDEDPDEPSTSAPSPKKRSSGRRSAPIKSPAKKKKTPQKKASPKKKTPAKSPPKKNKYGLPMEEEEEEDQEDQEEPSTSTTPKVRTRTSARLSKR